MKKTAPFEKNKITRRNQKRSEKTAFAIEMLRRVAATRRLILEARKRRQRLFLLWLLVILAMQRSIYAGLHRIFQNDGMWGGQQSTAHGDGPLDFIPDPANDFRPAPGTVNWCDGYSRDQWLALLKRHRANVNVLTPSQKAARDWLGDKDRELFPLIYRDRFCRPNLVDVMEDFRHEKSRPSAFIALLLLAPHDVHPYIRETYALDQSEIRSCYASRDHEILAALRARAMLWEARKAKEIEEASRATDDLHTEFKFGL